MTETFLFFWILALAYVWFETEAVPQYGEFLRLSFFKYKEFQKERKTNYALAGITYHNYLLMKHNNFFVRLVACPTCLTVWFNLIGYLILRFPIASLGVSIVGTWIGYHFLVWLIKKFNE